MQEVFEKIIGKLEELRINSINEDCPVIPNSEDCEAEYSCSSCFLCKAIEIVKQEAEQYNNGWIPYSERLPDDKQRCLTTAKIYFVPDHVDEEDNYIGVAIDTYFEKFGWSSNPEVIAWQPLPEPYTKGE